MKQLLETWNNYIAESLPNRYWYHGSPKNFESFQTFKRHTFGDRSDKTSIFFSPSKKFAKLYAQGPEATIYKVKLNVSNVFNTDDLYGDGVTIPPDRDELNDVGKQLYDDLAGNKIFPDLVKDDGSNEYEEMGEYGGVFRSIIRMEYDVMETPQMKKWIRTHGYDAFYVTGDGEINISVFYPDQISIIERELVNSPINESTIYVHGYVKPLSSFLSLSDWEEFAIDILKHQKDGHYVDYLQDELTGPNSEMVSLIQKFYSFQLNTEVERYDLLTTKNVLDHIEDFANYRYWAFEEQYDSFFDDISKLKFAFFYSRGDLEPYVLIDDEFTRQAYGAVDNMKTLYHYTTDSGIDRIGEAISSGKPFDISAYTIAERPFFREASNRIMKFEGNVRAGFRSDVKSYSVDNGSKCVNMYRLGYPVKYRNNLCTNLEDCDGELKTSLWNEFIATPVEILGVKER